MIVPALYQNKELPEVFEKFQACSYQKHNKTGDAYMASVRVFSLLPP